MTWLADHWLDLFGWAGSALLILSLLQARVLRFRLLNLVAGLMLVVFNALLGVWPMVAMNLATSAINVWFIRRLLLDRHDGAAFRVLAVKSDDVYLGPRPAGAPQRRGALPARLRVGRRSPGRPAPLPDPER